MKALFLSICVCVSALPAVCQEHRPSPEPHQSAGGMASGKNHVMRRRGIESYRTFTPGFTDLNTASTGETMHWSPPQLPPAVMQMKKNAVRNTKKETIKDSELQKTLGEKAYIFGVAADQNALQ